ncbi:GNAT family N-acetyltransferase [Dactylosporangium sp. NPDC051541]|uniref:GNAT family N-acetyltransferase n=1 Tax=Dactylosporangium sp. NPDC051541 TaxID=3363977 RepID=UPI00379892E9
MPEPLIRPARESDIAALERHLPTGPNRYHDARYARQLAGRSTFLLAFVHGEPIGHASVLWDGGHAEAVRTRYPGCPEINALAVAAPLQSQGIGTALIRAAETLAADRGCRQIGLGVDDSNPRAAALYRRLGYEETDFHYTDRYFYTDDAGHHEVADPCRFLIKHLT